jgi:hypothetical protein
METPNRGWYEELMLDEDSYRTISKKILGMGEDVTIGSWLSCQFDAIVESFDDLEEQELFDEADNLYREDLAKRINKQYAHQALHYGERERVWGNER